MSKKPKLDFDEVEKMFSEIDSANRLCYGIGQSLVFILSGAEKLLAEVKGRKGKR